MICEDCQEPLSGSIKTFEGRKFHADCFKCDECRDVLSGHIYPLNGKHLCKNCVLAIREAEQQQREMEYSSRTRRATTHGSGDSDEDEELFESPGDCHECKQPIQDQFFVEIEENVWHTDCFKCNECQAVLDPQQHSLMENGITRLCYGCDPSKRCTGCNDVIYGDATEFKGQPYHPNCFTCNQCNALLTGRVIVKDERNICENCHHNEITERQERIHNERMTRQTAATVATRTDRSITIDAEGFDFECSGHCTACEMPIEDKHFVRYDDQILHRACFKCAVCQGVLDPKKHSTLSDGRRVCFGCDPDKECDKCHDVIWDDATEFKGRRFHPDCFRCEECNVTLTDRVIVKDDRNVCERCFEDIREREEMNRIDEYECVGMCTKCRDPIEDQFYVRLDDGMMHKNCFKCHNCRIELDPKNHSTLEDGERVCFRCDPSKECQKCFDTIFEDVAEFQGKRYHPACFRCEDCNTLLSTHVVVRDGRNICEPCWGLIQEEQEKNHKDEYECAGICTTCCSPIEDKFFVRLEDGLLHTSCFKCNTCEVQLDPKEHSLLEDGRSRVCYNCDPTKQCEGCHQIIYDEATEFKGRRFHPQCFNCEECQAPLTQRVIVKNNRNVCETCYDDIREREEKERNKEFECVGECNYCSNPIDDQFYVRLDNGLRHKDCFKCHNCEVPLEPKMHSILKDGNRVCFECDPQRKCCKCSGVILDDATEYKNERFHPECFACDDCGEHLVNRVFTKGDGRFCEVCAKKVRGRSRQLPRQEPIHRLSVMTRDRAVYRDMTVERADSQVRTVRSSRVGTEANSVSGNTICDVCKDTIEDHYFVRVDDKEMHKNCFKCNECEAVLDPKFHTTLPDGNTRICYNCDPTKQCESCGTTIHEDASEFKGRRYHPRCFICDGCSAHLTNRVFMKDGLKYCEECKNCTSRRGTQNTVMTTNSTRTVRSQRSDANGDCSRCQEPLSGAVVNFDGRKFHSDCFVCDGCNDKLSGNIYPVDGQHFCKECGPNPASHGDSMKS